MGPIKNSLCNTVYDQTVMWLEGKLVDRQPQLKMNGMLANDQGNPTRLFASPLTLPPPLKSGLNSSHLAPTQHLYKIPIDNLNKDLGLCSRGEREFPFPVIPKNGGLWFPFPNFGNGFFHSLPVPEFLEWFISFPSCSQILGMDLFIPFLFSNFGFFYFLLVPEFWEWNFFMSIPELLSHSMYNT